MKSNALLVIILLFASDSQAHPSLQAQYGPILLGFVSPIPLNVTCDRSIHGCIPVNRQTCLAQPAESISLVLSRHPYIQPSNLPPPGTAYGFMAWLQNNAEACLWSNDANRAHHHLLVDRIIDPTQLPMRDAATLFHFPEDLHMALTVRNLLDEYGACDFGAEIRPTTWTLCLGIDLDADGAMGPSDLIDAVPLRVATEPPTMPSGTIAPFQGFCHIDAVIPADASYVEILTQHSSNMPSHDCGLWPTHANASRYLVHPHVPNMGFQLPGYAGVESAHCMRTIDEVGNYSAFAPLLTCTPL